MFNWQEWEDVVDQPQTIDLSAQTNEEGYIPLECPGKISPTGRKCSSKLLDGIGRKKNKGKVVGRSVHCTICGFSGWRKVAQKRKP